MTVQDFQLRIVNKNPCRLATTADHGLTGLTDVDGVTPVAGDRVLVRANSSGAENGIYLANASTWTRALDYSATPAEDQVAAGLTTYIQEGDANGGLLWTLTTTGTIDVGTTVTVFEQKIATGAPRSNVYFVGKHGSDDNDGKTPELAFLTVGKATTDIGANETPSATNLFEIRIVDAGRYVENVDLPNWVSLIGPTATIAPSSGTHAVQLGDKSVVRLALITTASIAVTFDNNLDEGWAYVDELNTSGVNPAVNIQAGTLYATIGRIVATSTGNGINMAGVAIANLDIGEIQVTTGKGLLTGGTTVSVWGRIAKISDGASAGQGILLGSTVAGKADLVIGVIDCDTTYSVAANNTLSLLVSDLIGSAGSVAGTANVTEAGVFPAGGDVSGPGSSVDNSLPRFDSTTGKVIQGGTTSDNVILDDSGNLHPEAQNGGALGLASSNEWSDLFLASGAVVGFDSGDVTITHSSNTLTFASATSGYKFANGPVLPGTNNTEALGTSSQRWADLFLGLGSVINFNTDVLVTHSSNTLTFTGASLGYEFDAALLPTSNDGAAIGASGTAWSDLFLALGAVINWNENDVSLTHAANTLTFGGATVGYKFADGPVAPGTTNTEALGSSALRWADLFLGDGSVINFNADATITHSSNTLTFGGASSGYKFDGGPVAPANTNTEALGSTSLRWADLFLGDASVINFNGDATITHSTNTLTFGGATLGYEFANGPVVPGTTNIEALGTTSLQWADLFLGTGSVLNFFNGDVTVTHSSNTLTFSGATSGYKFDDLLLIGRTTAHSGDNIFGIQSAASSTGAIAHIDNSATGAVTKRVLQLEMSADATISASEQWVRFVKSGSSEVGSINAEVVYSPFTGSHIGQNIDGMAEGIDGTGYYDEPVTPGTKRYWTAGMIVLSTGDLTGTTNISNAFVQLDLASTAQSKAVMGVFTEGVDNGNHAHTDLSKKLLYYNAVGEGKILVTDKAGDVDLGDYIESSTLEGYGQKQTDDIQHSYTVAKCIQQIVWADVTDTIDEGETTYKWALIACTYHCG